LLWVQVLQILILFLKGMKKVKKIMIFTITVTFLVSMLFIGTSTAQVGKSAEEMYFRLVTHGGDDPFWAVVAQGMRDAADELGCKAEIDFSGGDLAKQQKAFLEAVTSKPDGIALVINGCNCCRCTGYRNK
jgi:simple sugar transport system substrate-binding protein